MAGDQTLDEIAPGVIGSAHGGSAVSRGVAISSVSVATIQGALPAPVVFGDWIMNHREYAVVRVTSSSGHEGWAFTLTRDGAVAEQIRKTVAPVYVGQDPAERERLFRVASAAASLLTPPGSVCAHCRSSTSPPGTSRPRSPTRRSPVSWAAATRRCRPWPSSATRRG